MGRKGSASADKPEGCCCLAAVSSTVSLTPGFPAATSMDRIALNLSSTRSILRGVFEKGGGKVSRRLGGRRRGPLRPSLTAREVLWGVWCEVGVEGVDFAHVSSIPNRTRKSVVLTEHLRSHPPADRLSGLAILVELRSPRCLLGVKAKGGLPL